MAQYNTIADIILNLNLMGAAHAPIYLRLTFLRTVSSNMSEVTPS